jgi:hypothetical protein
MSTIIENSLKIKCGTDDPKKVKNKIFSPIKPKKLKVVPIESPVLEMVDNQSPLHTFKFTYEKEKNERKEIANINVFDIDDFDYFETLGTGTYGVVKRCV